jgi:hypothetical protein
LKNLSTLINSSTGSKDTYLKIEPNLLDWTNAGNNLLNRSMYIQAYNIYKGVQEISITYGDPVSMSPAMDELVKKYSSVPFGSDSVFEKAGFLCLPENTQPNLEDIELISLAINMDQSVSGKYLNCTKIKLDPSLLPESQAQAKYKITSDDSDRVRTLYKSCEYGGGYVWDLYTVDYKIRVIDTRSGKQLAETILPSREILDCDVVHTFVSKTESYDLAPSGEEISSWVSSLGLP